VPVRMSAGRWNRAETASTATPSTSANSPQMADSELITFVHNELLPALKEINGSLSPQHQAIKSVFEDANNYMKSGPSMLAIIEKLEEAINFHDFKTRAHLGDVYEQLLSDLRSAGVLHLPRNSWWTASTPISKNTTLCSTQLAAQGAFSPQPSTTFVTS
jgi:hypothetical protein